MTETDRLLQMKKLRALDIRRVVDAKTALVECEKRAARWKQAAMLERARYRAAQEALGLGDSWTDK